MICNLILMILFTVSCNKASIMFDLENSDYYFNKIITYFGDSITELSNSDDGYIQLLNKHFDLAKSYNCGISGTTIANNGTGLSFYEDVRIDSIPNESDYICIYGGINDCWQNLPIGNISIDNIDINTTVGAYNYLLDKLEERFESKIIIIVPHYTYLNNYESYINAIIEVAEINEIDFVDLYHNCGIGKDNYKFYTTDGVHLNKDGYALIAMSIGQSMIDNLY